MSEYDNAGFPLSYCLLSTTSAISQGKRTKALTSWAKCLRKAYNIKPTFAHVDKDMAEIKMLRTVWNPKISLCWWHLRRAVRTRLALNKITTTPYNVQRAHQEHFFISEDFRPFGRSDRNEYEGGHPDDLPEASEDRAILSSLPSTSSPPPPPPPTAAAPTPVPSLSQRPTIKLPPRSTQMVEPPMTQQRRVRLIVPDRESDSSDGEENEMQKRRTFCPEEFRTAIVDMMEKHYCAHPLIPGYAVPTPSGIKEWAVRQIYQFCVQNDLREVWAYLWENWYRAGRWELWARAPHPEIPVLKTTMILESQ
jgi:hypothetical protein